MRERADRPTGFGYLLMGGEIEGLMCEKYTELTNARAGLQPAVEGGDGLRMPEGRIFVVRIAEGNHEASDEDEILARKAPGYLMTEECAHCCGASR